MTAVVSNNLNDTMPLVLYVLLLSTCPLWKVVH